MEIVKFEELGEFCSRGSVMGCAVAVLCAVKPVGSEFWSDESNTNSFGKLSQLMPGTSSGCRLITDGRWLMDGPKSNSSLIG